MTTTKRSLAAWAWARAYLARGAGLIKDSHQHNSASPGGRTAWLPAQYVGVCQADPLPWDDFASMPDTEQKRPSSGPRHGNN